MTVTSLLAQFFMRHAVPLERKRFESCRRERSPSGFFWPVQGVNGIPSKGVKCGITKQDQEKAKRRLRCLGNFWSVISMPYRSGADVQDGCDRQSLRPQRAQRVASPGMRNWSNCAGFRTKIQDLCDSTPG